MSVGYCPAACDRRWIDERRQGDFTHPKNVLKEKFETGVYTVHICGDIVCKDEVVFVFYAQPNPIIDANIDAGTGCEAKVL